MKISQIQVRDFKRFTELTIVNIPETAKLIVLAGPNGSGKSSLFDAMNAWYNQNFSGRGFNWDQTYHSRANVAAGAQNITIEFHDPQPENQEARKKAIYVRTAYRNDPEFRTNRISRRPPILDDERIVRMIDNDASVSRNYERLVAQSVDDLHANDAGDTTFREYRENLLGHVRRSLLTLFPDLQLTGMGDPLQDGTFKFTKGLAEDFLYKNLSGGEKAVFDLILDIGVKRRAYNDTVYCIDEPEAHMNPALHGQLLEQLLSLIPDGSQLWVATHSIGMMRRARDYYRDDPSSTVIIDFDADFDTPQVLEPITPNRPFWEKAFQVALADMAQLVMPETVVICEGTPAAGQPGRNAEHDARCYDAIFANELPEVKFIAGGNAHDVANDRLGLVRAMQVIGVPTIVRLIDRDNRSAREVTDYEAEGGKVLSLRHIENYLFDDEVLTKLCNEHGADPVALLQAKQNALAASQARGKPADDVKNAAGEIYTQATKLIAFPQPPGNSARAFMRDTLAPLITSDMTIHQTLRRDIFGQ